MFEQGFRRFLKFQRDFETGGHDLKILASNYEVNQKKKGGKKPPCLKI